MECDQESIQGKIKPGYWAVVTLVVSPSLGTVTSYVNNNFSHVSTNLDPADLKLNHKIVVLGGGKQAHARGGDVRRLVIHSKALDQKGVLAVFSSMASSNPGVGKRITKFQALYRGFMYRKVNKIVKEGSSDDKEKEEDNESENNGDEQAGVRVY